MTINQRRFTGTTDPGLLRKVNQDNYYTDPEGRFFIVADGMGGHAGGQEASLIATKQIQSYLEEHWQGDLPSDLLLAEAFGQANQGILDDQHSHPERGDMGTTAVVVLFRQGQPWYAHIGDSRLYRLRDGQLEQITDDHTWVARAQKYGDISSAEAKNHPWRHVLFQCLGRKDLGKIDIDTVAVQGGDVLLLCSDGLTEEVSDELIRDLLLSRENLEQIAQELVEAAKNAGGSDNITVVIVAEEEEATG
jgi:protein phosphatase